MKLNEKLSLYDIVVYFLVFLSVVIVTVPVMHIISVSLEPELLAGKPGRFQILPKEITFGAYGEALARSDISRALLNSAYVTLLSAGLGTVCTGMFAYALTFKKLPGKKLITMIAVFTMAFNVGIIPRYLLLKDLGMLNTLWALIIPPMMWASHMIIMRAFFNSQPASLRESAVIDGAHELTIFFRIIIPLSMPIIATIFLFYAVTRWNSYFDAVIFIDRRHLKTIQVLLREVLIEHTVEEGESFELGKQYGENLKMAIAVISILPIVIVYPFLQKYFVKGSLIGAVKG
jgi:putative aldouronate transport system permease protein